ncbi:hypothetical protein [Vibrio sp. qd031]|uniref:hypothetical protein n=1 Tax=Vibrio sp. qd031 TaxID=1603038 RepID=UPI00117C6BBB|nr:hypothetical protein [Vibrio sp. qd031]
MQKWLNSNRELLSSHGVYYPKHSVAGHDISSGHMGLLLREKDKQWVLDDSKFNNLISKFESMDEHTLLLSSEFFFRLIPDLVKRLPDAEFLLYVRNPTEMLESSYNQGVKRHGYFHKLKTPEKAPNQFWNTLDKILCANEPIKMVLRPYHKECFHNGSIVADFLFSLGIEYRIEDSRINPSYTLPALEFKRLANYFPLEKLSHRLDSALQGYTKGSQRYSLIEPEMFAKLNRESMSSLQGFLEKYDFGSLQPLLGKFSQAKQKSFVEQHATQSELGEVWQYLNEIDRTLSIELRDLVAKHANIPLDNETFYAVLGVTSKVRDISDIMDRELIESVGRFTISPDKRGKVLFELARYHETKGELNLSVSYSSAAHYYSPHNQRFFSFYIKQLVKVNELTASSTANSDSKRKLSQRVQGLLQLRRKK